MRSTSLELALRDFMRQRTDEELHELAGKQPPAWRPDDQLDQARAVLAAAGETPVTKREVTWKLRELFEGYEYNHPFVLDSNHSRKAAEIVMERRSEVVRLLGLIETPPQQEEPTNALP